MAEGSKHQGLLQRIFFSACKRNVIKSRGSGSLRANISELNEKITLSRHGKGLFFPYSSDHAFVS